MVAETMAHNLADSQERKKVAWRAREIHKSEWE